MRILIAVSEVIFIDKLNESKISILAAPKILQNPSDLKILNGDSAYFSCRVEGDPLPEITWMLNTNEINQNDPRIFVQNDGTLQIRKTISSDEGQYMCIAKNEIGTIKSKPAQMSLKNVPTKLKEEVKDDDEDNDDAEPATQSIYLHCNTSAKAKPNWYFNMELITAKNDIFKMFENGTLMIREPNDDREGSYKCESLDELGMKLTVAEYDLKGK